MLSLKVQGVLGEKMGVEIVTYGLLSVAKL